MSDTRLARNLGCISHERDLTRLVETRPFWRCSARSRRSSIVGGPYPWFVFYHHAQAGLPAGTVIQPGSWGRSAARHPFGAWAIIERVFEDCRRELAPFAPSRLACTFVYDDHATALEYLAQQPDEASLYVVEHVDRDAAMHRGCISWVDKQLANRALEEIETAAKWYWTQPVPDGRHAEVLSASPLKIISLAPIGAARS